MSVFCGCCVCPSVYICIHIVRHRHRGIRRFFCVRVCLKARDSSINFRLARVSALSQSFHVVLACRRLLIKVFRNFLCLDAFVRLLQQTMTTKQRGTNNSETHVNVCT